ncbi:aldehyde dehydrogenase family protein [Rhizobium sp. L1K21]|uniref:aldehyde dehydrogenase family protein n=1 Tax=Rhizobium sp. L1K21 TaxID=2954933 RepID=UPI002093D4E0|nr:aldehyde dehydrogenase family protein [Rhizobium sp. L1K21]MCO6187858.1 aldehyde dehydrogenase family protein [Rhizobium sp. L1K21]
MNVHTTLTAYDGFTGQYINGQWCSGSAMRELEDFNPYNDNLLTRIAMAGVDDLDRAYEAAQQAQKSWAMALPKERAAIFHNAVGILDRRRDEIIDWIIRESGSTRMKATIEFNGVRDGMIEAASMPYLMHGFIMPVDRPGKEARVYRKPVGVIAVISPWNVPLHLSNRSVAPALALGNAVVLKPASDTPVTGGLLLAKIYEEAGLPPGVLNVVIGAGSDIGDAFCAHPIPRIISFTGSTEVGQRIARISGGSPRLKKLGLELGGNSPLVILDDADIDVAVKAALVGRFDHCGQICMSTNRIIVDGALYDNFLDAFCAAVSEIKCGDPNADDTMIGPLCNDAQVQSVTGLIESGRQQGFDLRVSGETEGRIIPPHVFAGVTNDSRLARSEIFGPVAPVIRAADEREALAFANDTEYGLSSAVITGDEQRGMRFAQGLEAGMTHINDMTIHDFPHVMFGGEKNSGLGRFNGHWIIEEFTTDHLVTVQR